MGYQSEGEKLAKKIYSLAYHRATASIVARHRDEFEKLLTAHKANIRFEYETFGEIDTTRSPRKHVEDEERGVCEFDGQEWPCKQELANRRTARRRAERSGRSSTTSSSGEETSPPRDES